MARGVGPFLLVSLKLQGPYGGVWLRVSDRYFLWSGVVLHILVELIAFCSLLTWAEKKEVKQLITHEAIISSINVVIMGNGNPLQYSCLENPMDGGAW